MLSDFGGPLTVVVCLLDKFWVMVLKEEFILSFFKEFSMPIFEFKCLKCQEYIEILVMGTNDDQVQMTCTRCGSDELERILSSTNFNMAPGGAAKSQSSTQTRKCSAGSCTTWNLPGHSR